MVQGSNGEAVYLSKEEKVEMVKKVRQAAAKDKLILAGAGCECKSRVQFNKLSQNFYLVKVRAAFPLMHLHLEYYLIGAVATNHMTVRAAPV